MREIKFRTYVIGSGEMLYGKMATAVQMFTNGYRWRNAEVVVMQCTGLKDKNGVEIYEGDILKFDDMGEEGYEYSEGFDFDNSASVCFKNGRFELENFRSNNSGVLNEMNQEDHETFIAIFEQSKIIGNIYEKPELIDQ